MAMRGDADMRPCCQGQRYRAAVRQLLPDPAEVDPFEAHAQAHRPSPPNRPWVLVNMVASIDGATAIDGVSGGLGGPADKEVFRAIRAVADVILVAGGTVRSEGYGPARPSAAVQADRVARGQQPVPRLAVVSGSLDLDPASPLFAESVEPPLIFTTTGDNSHGGGTSALSAAAEIVPLGHPRVDVDQLLADLHARGVRCVVAEGGPQLNGQLIAAGVVDEFNLTTSPMLVAGPSDRVAHGAAVAPEHLAIAHLWQADGLVFTRYVRR